MSGVSLYERQEQMDAALAALEAAESEEERQVALEAVTEAAGALMEKVDRFSAYLATLESVEDLGAAEVKRIQQRVKVARARREHLEQYAIGIMQAHGWESLEGETSALKLRKNSPSVKIDDELAIPAQFIVTTQSSAPDKVAIKVALKSGREVPGARLESSVGIRRT